MPNFFYTDAKGQKHLLTPAQVRALAARGIIKPDTPLENENGRKGLAGQIRGLFAEPLAASTTLAAEPARRSADESTIEPARRSADESTIEPARCSVRPAGGAAKRQIPTTVGFAIIFLVIGVGVAILAWDRPFRERGTVSRNITAPQERSGVSVSPRQPAQTAPATQQQTATQPAPVSPTVQLPPGWTQEQYQTLMKFRAEVRQPGTFAQRERDVLIHGDLKDIDPILIGRNILFGPDWLEFVGTNRQLSRQQFQAWRDRLDRVHDSYKELIGSGPIAGEKITISAQPATDFRIATVSGSANGANRIARINGDILRGTSNASRVFFESIRRGGVTHFVPHEMAHIFAHNRNWEIEHEATAEFLMAYALESLNFHYGVPGFNHDPRQVSVFAQTRGTQLRELSFNVGLHAFRNNTITPIAGRYACLGSVHAFYKFGLAGVNGVGWDAFKLAFRSYDDPNFAPRYQYRSSNSNRQQALRHEQARDLFDRVAQFSEIARRTNNPNEALRTLPDRGQLLDQHLPVTKTPNTRTQAELQPARFRGIEQLQQQAQQRLQQQAQQRSQEQMGR